ncbi:hypothetical protein VNO77_25082 [Canavalia gladiata]|uniref:Secreted protein n=1 Tax=Canavalia gladiata TaxID=3824 RepID=A0AAN9QD58_CANGL
MQTTFRAMSFPLSLFLSISHSISNGASNDYYVGNSSRVRFVMIIVFELGFESHMQEHVASITRRTSNLSLMESCHAMSQL